MERKECIEKTTEDKEFSEEGGYRKLSGVGAQSKRKRKE